MVLIAFTLASVLGFSASTTFNVLVGEGGQLQYYPNEVIASKGDTIMFVFTDGDHSLTQSTFGEPCTPMEGGINSGFLPFPNPLASEPPSYTLRVNSTSGSLWFFCAQTLPVSHCKAGMVFAVNPTIDQTLPEFVLTANSSHSGSTDPVNSVSPASKVPSSETRVMPTSEPATTSSTLSSPTVSGTTSTNSSSQSVSNARIVIPISICVGLTVIPAVATLLWCGCVRRGHKPVQTIGWTVKTALQPFLGTPETGTTNHPTGDIPRFTASKRSTKILVPDHPEQLMPQQLGSTLPHPYVKSNQPLLPEEHRDISNMLDQRAATVLPAPELPSERGMLITMIRRLEAVEATIAHIRQPDPAQVLDSNSSRTSLSSSTILTNDQPPDYVSQPESEPRRNGGMEQGLPIPMPPLTQKS